MDAAVVTSALAYPVHAHATRSPSDCSATTKRARKKPDHHPYDTYATVTRAQKDSRLYNLTLDIHDLKQQLRDLSGRRELLYARSFCPRANANVSVLRTVGRYFQGFASGYRGHGKQPEHTAFVRSIVGAEFSLGITGLGVDMLLEQWRRYTELFHIRESILHSAQVLTTSHAREKDDEDEPSFVIAKCAVHFRGVLTRAAIDKIFPMAKNDPALLLQTLGREITLPMLFHLYFGEDGRLVRHDAEADFVHAVCDALGGDLTTAVRFLADAQVGQESMVGPIPQPVITTESTATPQKKLRRDESITDDNLAKAAPPILPRPVVVSPNIQDDVAGHDATGEQVDGKKCWTSDARLAVSYLLSPASAS